MPRTRCWHRKRTCTSKVAVKEEEDEGETGPAYKTVPDVVSRVLVTNIAIHGGTQQRSQLLDQDRQAGKSATHFNDKSMQRAHPDLSPRVGVNHPR